ncbi:MAG: prepilin-type N-terminal cleavage/methylation domain-containing protein [Planctomycetota bacterium]|nr:prepilin-type N-terminal cleavage/methylation domain-containing protein [Planctomycetota bacterium]
MNRLCQSQPTDRKQAFTLIELLVVIGIVAVCGSLLMPALIKARASAQRATCVGNLRQLGYAAIMYSDDNEGRAFRYSFGSTNGGKLYWFGWLQDGPEESREFDLTKGVLWPYLQAGGVELCPALQYHATRFKRKAKGAAYGYGYNLHLAGSSTTEPSNLASLIRPSEIALFADAAQVNTFQAPASPTNPLLEEFYYINTTERTTHFRHQREALVVFSDGHVTGEIPLTGSLDSRLADARVGRLRPQCLREE